MMSLMGNDEKKLDPVLSSDQSVGIYQKLIEKIRAGMFASTLTLTFRYILLNIGQEKTMAIARKFWRKTTPQSVFIGGSIETGRIFAGAMFGYPLPG
mgnify:FL=1